MKKKRTLHLGALTTLLLFLFAGCGTNKNIDPVSDLKLHGADPPTINVGVNPPQIHVTYFVFTVTVHDPNLSLVPADAWIISSYDITYQLLSDPGHHIQSLPASEHKKTHTKVQPGQVNKVAVTIVSDTWVQDNAAGFIGTSDTAIIKAHVVFHAYRQRDGATKDLATKFLFTVGNF
jgi:hypothetical protein